MGRARARHRARAGRRVHGHSARGRVQRKVCKRGQAQGRVFAEQGRGERAESKAQTAEGRKGRAGHEAWQRSEGLNGVSFT